MQAVKNGSVFEKVVGVNGEKFLMPGIPLFIKRLFRLKKQKISSRLFIKRLFLLKKQKISSKLFIKRPFLLKKQKIPLREVDSSLFPKCRSFL